MALVPQIDGEAHVEPAVRPYTEVADSPSGEEKIAPRNSIIDVRARAVSARNDAIFAVKGVAILGVVLHHVRNRRLAPDASMMVSLLMHNFTWCVLAFLAVSGWLHAAREIRSNASAWQFTRLRISRLLLPFIALVFFYAAIWQMIQESGVVALNGGIPTTFGAKIVASLLLERSGSVGEQLWFLPTLFFLSVTTKVILDSTGRRGILAVCLALLVVGTMRYGSATCTGFSGGTVVWGAVAYTAGFLVFEKQDRRSLYWLTALVTAAMGAGLGLTGVLKTVPLVLLTVMNKVRLGRLPVLPKLGEAAGTIFAYHTPFLLQPLVMAATRSPGAIMQVAGVVSAALIAIAVTSAMHFLLRNTRFGWITL